MEDNIEAKMEYRYRWNEVGNISEPCEHLKHSYCHCSGRFRIPGEKMGKNEIEEINIK